MPSQPRTCAECGGPMPDGAHGLQKSCGYNCLRERQRKKAAVSKARKRFAPSGVRAREAKPPLAPLPKQPQQADIPAYADLAGYDDEQDAFVRAVAEYKRRTKRQFPTLCELLGVLKGMGYRRTQG